MLFLTLMNVADTSEPDYVYEAEYIAPPRYHRILDSNRGRTGFYINKYVTGRVYTGVITAFNKY